MSQYEVLDGIRTLPRDVPLSALLSLAGFGQGRTYYVNNISGSSGNTGLSWDAAMDEPSTAITASEAFRALPSGSTNDQIANHIVIQGTSTAYTGITDLGERCFITGLSAGLMRDGGSGQVRLGTTTTDGCDDASNARGNTLYNIQFQAGGNNNYAFRNTAWIQRSRFQDVTFQQVESELEAGFYSSNISGSIFERCTFSVQAGAVGALYGMQFAGQVSDCLITDCIFTLGTTSNMELSNSNHVNTVVSHNYFMGGQTTETSYGFHDLDDNGLLMLAHNYFAADGILNVDISRVSNLRTVGNMLSGDAGFISS